MELKTFGLPSRAFARSPPEVPPSADYLRTYPDIIARGAAVGQADQSDSPRRFDGVWVVLSNIIRNSPLCII